MAFAQRGARTSLLIMSTRDGAAAFPQEKRGSSGAIIGPLVPRCQHRIDAPRGARTTTTQGRGLRQIVGPGWCAEAVPGPLVGLGNLVGIERILVEPESPPELLDHVLDDGFPW
jgi:hypothetical protein